jgi:hypothetical protein
MNRLHCTLAFLLAVALGVGGCGEELQETSRDGTYVGQFEGSESLLGFVVKDDVVVAYVCGDQAHWRLVAGIFSGTLSTKDGSFVVNNELGLTNEGVIGEGSAEGWLELKSGEMLNWSATRVPDDGRAGLYIADADEAFTGLIVTADDKANGANYEKDCCSSFVAVEGFASDFASVEVTARKCGEYGDDAVHNKTLTRLTAASVSLRQVTDDKFLFEADPQVWYLDVDGDGFGQDGRTIFACQMPYRGAAMAGDCDDMDASVNPGADNCE